MGLTARNALARTGAFAWPHGSLSAESLRPQESQIEF
jgi:hypothetical protein